MTTISLRACLALAIGLSVSIPALAQAPQRPSVSTFFQQAVFSGAEMSPNGRFVAFRVAPKGSRARLGVLDLETMQATPVES